jgi:hypothetical protein
LVGRISFSVNKIKRLEKENEAMKLEINKLILEERGNLQEKERADRFQQKITSGEEQLNKEKENTREEMIQYMKEKDVTFQE